MQTDSGREGFALVAVVFLLFAIGVAAATGYRVVQGEVRMSHYAGDAGKALAIAEAGLHRFVSDPEARLDTDTVYAIDGGEAAVAPRKVLSGDFGIDTYLVTSTGSFAEMPVAYGPATRTARQFIARRRGPVNVLAAVSSTGRVEKDRWDFHLSGLDAASALDCPESGSNVLAAIAGNGFQYQGPLNQFEGGVESHAGPNAVLNVLDVTWDFLTGPDLVPDETTLPTGYAPGVFPVIRIEGDLVQTSGAVVGRGLLIVTGSLQVDPAATFHWDGMILTGETGDVNSAGFRLEGMLGVGLDGGNDDLRLLAGDIRFNSCAVLAAGERFSDSRLVLNSWAEVR